MAGRKSPQLMEELASEKEHRMDSEDQHAQSLAVQPAEAYKPGDHK